MISRILMNMTLVCAIGLAGCSGDAPQADVVRDEELTGESPPPPSSIGDTLAEQPGITVAAVIESPKMYLGQSLTSEVRVTRVPTQRGFWIEEQGERLFVVLIGQPQEEPVDIRPNTTLQLGHATVRDRTFLHDLPGEPLDPDTESILRTQAAFLVVDESDIEVVARGAQPASASRLLTLQL